MTNVSKPVLYRNLIDRLVDVCHAGQGQIGARRVRAGVWNAAATPLGNPDQHEFNALLARLPNHDRDVIARMISGEVELGVFETLKALEEFGVPPFNSGYEGSACNDFVGRLHGWEWPRN